MIDQFERNKDNGFELARQSSIVIAQKRVMTAEEEEKQKKELIQQQKNDKSEKLEGLILTQTFETTNHLLEKEFFVDN